MTVATFWRLSLCLVTGSILYLALAPAPPASGLGWDKANHAAAMAFFTVVAVYSFRPAKRALFFGAAYALLLGAMIELLQKWCTATRSAEWMDFLADAVGTAGVYFFLKVNSRRAVKG